MRRKSYRILRPGCPGTTGTLLPQSRSKPLPPADHRSPTALVIDLTKEVFHACRKGTNILPWRLGASVGNVVLQIGLLRRATQHQPDWRPSLVMTHCPDPNRGKLMDQRTLGAF